AGGNWIPDMIEMLGGNSLIAKAGEHSDWITLDEIAAANPDVIVLLPCGFNLSRTITEAAALEKLPGWNQLDAVKNKRVYATDGSSFFNRPGPRLVDSLEILGEIFYPGMIEFGRESAHWQSLY
ncbi:MAG: ABC transporter substrate-binding protein, partial [Verrucomicrobiae bacterium]|nr:ABC transporter substrate-binding protein [Verrucomicrobiae bacterium]